MRDCRKDCSHRTICSNHVNFQLADKPEFIQVSQAMRVLETENITARTVGFHPSFDPRTSIGIIMLVNAHQRRNGFDVCYDLDTFTYISRLIKGGWYKHRSRMI